MSTGTGAEATTRSETRPSRRSSIAGVADAEDDRVDGLIVGVREDLLDGIALPADGFDRRVEVGRRGERPVAPGPEFGSDLLDQVVVEEEKRTVVDDRERVDTAVCEVGRRDQRGLGGGASVDRNEDVVVHRVNGGTGRG